MTKPLRNRVIIVTGGASGIGAAIVHRLHAEGAQVVIGDVLDSEGLALAESLGNDVAYQRLDVSHFDAWQSAVAFAEKRYGPVTGLVNNAGIFAAAGPIQEVAEADFRRVIDINLVAVFLGMKAVLPSMKKSPGGSIVNISSVAAIVGNPETLAYTASKAGVRGMSKSAALEFAPLGIRVNSVHPGYVDTQMIASQIPSEQAEEFRRSICPLGRLAAPAEIASLVLFLISDESSYVTGGEYIIDGGYSAR